MQHAGSLVVACKLLVVACGSLLAVCGRKEQLLNKRLTQTYLWVSRSPWQRPGLAVACCRVQGTGPFEGDRHYLHYFHHSLASGQTTGREHNPTHQQKIGLKIYGERPCPSEQDPVSPTVSLSYQEASIRLLSLSFRGQAEWKWQSQKTNQTGDMDHESESEMAQSCLTLWLQSMGSLRARHDWATSLSLFTFHFHTLEKEMATHSSVLAWRIPRTEEPSGLPSMGSHRVGHDWSDLAAAAAAAGL